MTIMTSTPNHCCEQLLAGWKRGATGGVIIIGKGVVDIVRWGVGCESERVMVFGFGVWGLSRCQLDLYC